MIIQLDIQHMPYYHMIGRGRLLHGPNWGTLRQSLGYETWIPFGWHNHFVIGWPKYRLGLPRSQRLVCSHDRREFPLFFRGHWQSPHTAPRHSPNDRQMPVVSAVQRDRERVQARGYWGLTVECSHVWPGDRENSRNIVFSPCTHLLATIWWFVKCVRPSYK